MARAELVLADPAVRVFRSAQQTLFIHGGDETVATSLSGFIYTPNNDIESCCRGGSEITVIRVSVNNSDPVQIDIWRPVHSKYEVFYRQEADGRVRICDTMRNAIALTPPAKRDVPEDSVLDHLIFRRIPLDGTLVSGWRRIAPGQKVSLDLKNAKVNVESFDRVAGNVVHMSPAERLDQLDRLFAETMGPLQQYDGLACLFSGGVDSTLIYTYLDPAVPAITAMPETLPADEAETLEKAAELLQIEPHYLPHGSSGYLKQLETAIDGFGVPPELDQIAFYTQLYATGHKAYLSGTPADSLFGAYPADGWAGFFMLMLIRFGGVGLARSLAPMVPKRHQARVYERADWAEEFRHPLLHSAGTSAMEDAFTSFDVLRLAYDQHTIEQRLQKRLESVIAMVELTAPKNDRYHQHMELLHWIGYLAGGGALQERQHGLAYGKAVLFPFADRRLMDFMSAIPVPERYLTQTRQAKPWLKRLLDKRLPRYPSYARKGTTQYPMADFFAEGGPLAHVWDKYDLPEPLQTKAAEPFHATWSDLNWNALGFAIWRDRVLHNATLKVTPTAQTFSFDARDDATPAYDLAVS